MSAPSKAGSYTQRIEQACEKLVSELYAAGVAPDALRKRLGLLPRSPFARFYRTKGESAVEMAERRFVEEMQSIGVEMKWDIYLGESTHYWCSFPEAHNYFARSLARLLERLQQMRIEESQRAALSAMNTVSPMVHGAANLSDILGLQYKAPNKAPEPTPGAVTPRATEGAPK